MAVPGFLKKIMDTNQAKADRIFNKFKGQSTLYAGDPTLHWGTGGWVRGRCTLFYGPKGSGKSTQALIAAAAEQKLTNGYVIVYDSEYNYADPHESHAGQPTEEALRGRIRYTQAGLDWEKVVVIKSNEVDNLFGNLKAIEDGLKDDPSSISAIVVDSWGGVQSEQARNKIDAGTVAAAGNSFGGNAKTIGPIVQHLSRIGAEHGVSQFWVQHCMANQDQYGPKWLLLGGQKLQFLVHTIVFFESATGKDSHLVEGDVQSKEHADIESAQKVGKKVYFRVEKSRLTVEGKKGEIFMNFEECRFAMPQASLMNLALKLNVLKQGGAWFSFTSKTGQAYKWQGSKGVAEALKKDQAIYDEIFAACQKSVSVDATGGAKISEVLVEKDEDDK